MQIVVLGMHRSGTSSVTRILNLAGAWFGPDGSAIDANDENPRGFWERRDVRAVCDGLLGVAGRDWWDLADFEASRLPEDDVAPWALEMTRIAAEAAEQGTWVVKEPRLCVLLPLLAPALIDAVYVHVTREPIEVARSVNSRDGIDMSAAIALWERYTVDSFNATSSARRLLVRYEDLIAEPVAAATRLIEGLVELGADDLHPVPEGDLLAFVSKDLHRQRASRAERDGWMNADQIRLAERIDDGSILDPGAPATMSPAGESTLRLLADARRSEDLEGRLDAESRYLDVEVARRRLIARRALFAIDAADELLERYADSGAGRMAQRLIEARQTVTPGFTKTVNGPIDRIRREMRTNRREIEALGRLAPAPGSASALTFATGHPLIRSTQAEPPEPTGRPKVAVLAWDVGHNPLGRANVLAEVLSRHFDVQLWGAQFERYGATVWAPLQALDTPLNVFPGKPFPAHMRAMEQVAGEIDADLIWVSKPRLPSYALGILAKQLSGTPLVLDVDDHELAFFGVDEGLSVDEAIDRPAADLEWPFERAWTQACDPLIGAADLVTVSNPALQQRYGGILVPHARDERRFDPATVDRAAARERLGIPEGERALLFGGTPRVHKGVIELLAALDRLGDDRYRLLVFGTRELDELRDRIGDLDRWARIIEPQPFADLPAVVAAADLSCVLQDPSHPVSRYQMPAKVSDALAMGVPCLVVPTPPLEDLIAADLLEVWKPGEELHERIARVFEDYDDARARALRGRAHFRSELSYSAVGDALVPVFEALIADPPDLDPRLVELIEAPDRVFAGQDGIPITARYKPRKPRRSTARHAVDRPAVADTVETADSTGVGGHVDVYDVVMFWKQNDSGIYGRRQDMFLDELRRSDRVGRIVHFDGPTSAEFLARSYLDSLRHKADQRRLVATETMARVLHRRDEPGVVRHTFLHGGRFTSRLGRPPRWRYPEHARSVLANEGFGDRPLVLWAYPANDDLPRLIDAIRPDVVVADLVDDNRTWYEAGDEHVARIEANYREVLARADVAIANCEPVAKALAGYIDEPIHVVPNGLELNPEPSNDPRPAFMRGMTGPVIGYVGNLSSRLDLDLISEIARARPGWNFVFVGSAHLDRSILDLDRLGNVHFPGVLPYRKVRGFLSHVDVAIIPHLDNEMTRSMNPLKAFVYASAGVPAVSTPVANLVDLGDLMTVAEGPDAFLAAIEAHLARPRPHPDTERLREHSWQQRVETVFSLIDSLPN
ncbi:MAG: glycosyltransferase [Acidimicrobiales bacterium]|nr:glycosyltransferase [Acidimicrobiales bacterium]